MALNKIKTSSLDDDSVTSAKLANGAVTANDINDGELPLAKISQVNLDIAPEVLEIQVSAPQAGQDTAWLWTWLTSSLPYARREVTNSPEIQVPLYRQGTYTVNNYAAYDLFDDMTQTHSLYLKWIDGAGTDNLVSWATSTGPVSDSHPDINGGNATDVQRINISVPATITLPTLTPPTVSYTVVNNGTGAYTFSGSAKGDNPNIGPFYRGGTYTFNITATGHPLYLTTDNGTNFASGTYFGEYTDGVTGSRTDNGTLTIVVPNDAPDTLYYQCGNHGVMRGAITVKDLAVETNINGNPVVYFQHTQEGHKTPVELRPIPSLVNQMCLVYDAGTGKFVPQDLATYVENTPSFENKIREVAGTAELVVEDGSAVVAKVNVYQDSTYLPLVGNNAGDQAFATDTNKLYIWDGSAWQLAGAANTGELPEGTNLYYTDARVDARLASGNVGDLVVGGNLTVNGTTTTINSTTLTVDDKNIVLGSGATDNNTADGAGITVDGSNASLTYVSSGDTWTMNKELRLDNNKGIFFRNAADTGSLGIKADTSDNITFRDGTNWDRVVINTAGLTVDGKINAGDISLFPDGVIDSGSSTGSLTLIGGGTNHGGKIYLDGGNNDGYIAFYSQQYTATPLERMRIANNGNIGISTTDPQATLDSAGVIRQTRDIVSDSVFKSFTIGSNRQTDDYGGLNKEYWAIQLQTPGPSTTGESSQHAYGSLKFSGVSAADTTLDDVLVLKHNGYVGIGTNNPQAKLHINGSDENIRLDNTGTSNYGLEIWRGGNKGASIAWGEGNANLEIKNYRNDSQSTGPYANIDFYTGGANATSPNYNPDLRMRIQQTGEVGIGTANPMSLLHIQGDGTTLRLDGSGNTTRRIFFRSTTTSNPAEIYADGTLQLWTEDPNTSILLKPQNNNNYRIEHNQNGFYPSVDNQLDLGRYDQGWKNVYTNDLQLSNMNSEDGNEVDGTKGKWTIQEGEEELFIINRLTGKKYAFMLREIE